MKESSDKKHALDRERFHLHLHAQWRVTGHELTGTLMRKQAEPEEEEEGRGVG